MTLVRARPRQRHVTHSEVSQISNVDVHINVDMKSHPMGINTPKIFLCLSAFQQNFVLVTFILISFCHFQEFPWTGE